MKSRRPIAINNSLVHGICNLSCITCSVNKPEYRGPKQYQPEHVTKKIIERVIEAASRGIYISRIDNSGDGEPTLHPEFNQRMDLFGDLKSNWGNSHLPPPEISIVTNSLKLDQPGVIESIVRNKINVNISFPTSDPVHYGEIMIKNKDAGRELFPKAMNHIRQMMELVGKGKVPKIKFHISPPYIPYVRKDFPRTVDFLVELASKASLKELHLEMFPGVANRIGRVLVATNRIDMYKDYFKKYHNKKVSGVRIVMTSSHNYFYPTIKEYFDVLRSYRYPCMRFAACILLSHNGECFCSNDQSIEEVFGDIFKMSLDQIIERKETLRPKKICDKCNQSPRALFSIGFFRPYNLIAIIKETKYSISNKKN